MTAVDYILEGIAKNLEVERELGTRTVEIDRALLKVAEGGHAGRVTLPPKDESAAPTPTYDFVFLHHAALNPDGIEMMAKIVTAMHSTPERSPILFTGVLPKARYYIVLGQRALAQWFPTLRGAMDRWITGEAGEEVLYTHSPDEFTRFNPIPKTSPLYRQKAEMWTALKGVMQRLVVGG